MRNLVIVGARGFGREVAWTAMRVNSDAPAPLWNILGFADDAAATLPHSVADLPVLGALDDVASRFSDSSFFIATGDGRVREKIAARLEEADFPSIVDPSAIVAQNAVLGKGVFAGPLSIISDSAVVGDFSVVNARAGIGHDCAVGPFATISPGVSLSGFTTVGRRAFFGANSSTVPGVSIGADAIVAAGVPVYTSLKDGTTLSPFGVFAAKPSRDNGSVEEK